MHHQLISLLLLIIAIAVQFANAGQCNPNYIPEWIDKSKTFTIVPEISTMNIVTPVRISGLLSMVSGCEFVFNNFTYLPDLGQTMLYAVKADSPLDPNAFPISTVPALANEGRSPLKFTLDTGKNLSDFNFIKLYSVLTKTVIGTVNLYSLNDHYKVPGGVSNGGQANYSSSLILAVTSSFILSTIALFM